MKHERDVDALKLKHTIGQRFEELRNDLGLSQTELSLEIGTTQNLIYRIETDVNTSLSSFLMVMLWYIKNRRLNPEWLLSPDNEGLYKYYTSSRISQRKKDHLDEKRNAIVEKMVVELERLKQKPNELPPGQEG